MYTSNNESIADIQWTAQRDFENGQPKSTPNWEYNHEYEYQKQRAESFGPGKPVEMPNLLGTSSSTALTTTGSSSYATGGSSTASSKTNSDSGEWLWVVGGIWVLYMALPLIAWTVGLLASRVQPWAHAVTAIGQHTGLFNPTALTGYGLYAAALIGQWIVCVLLCGWNVSVARVLLVIATMFAATEALKAGLDFAYLRDTQCADRFALIPHTCAADLWSHARSLVTTANLPSLTGLAPWAMTVVTALVYVGLGVMVQAAVLWLALLLLIVERASRGPAAPQHPSTAQLVSAA
jgi:hypothetical protein